MKRGVGGWGLHQRDTDGGKPMEVKDRNKTNRKLVSTAEETTAQHLLTTFVQHFPFPPRQAIR